MLSMWRILSVNSVRKLFTSFIVLLNYISAAPCLGSVKAKSHFYSGDYCLDNLIPDCYHVFHCFIILKSSFALKNYFAKWPLKVLKVMSLLNILVMTCEYIDMHRFSLNARGGSL